MTIHKQMSRSLITCRNSIQYIRYGVKIYSKFIKTVKKQGDFIVIVQVKIKHGADFDIFLLFC